MYIFKKIFLVCILGVFQSLLLDVFKSLTRVSTLFYEFQDVYFFLHLHVCTHIDA
ncbi:unnamed protein product [Pararhodospirillum photometricum DSM 122]|uniref:Uncharacterized protein n=1 Tax=Pararhodospirillum photometricum DSM 122 TaxID=1150469 RepID=H6SPL8_PARPM|nr:unnamed protein product [Pararhodospirillum photometricum DSM 122]